MDKKERSVLLSKCYTKETNKYELSLNNSIDDYGYTQILINAIRLGMAETEAQKISERTKIAVQSKLSRRSYINSPVVQATQNK